MRRSGSPACSARPSAAGRPPPDGKWCACSGGRPAFRRSGKFRRRYPAPQRAGWRFLFFPWREQRTFCSRSSPFPRSSVLRPLSCRRCCRGSRPRGAAWRESPPARWRSASPPGRNFRPEYPEYPPDKGGGSLSRFRSGKESWKSSLFILLRAAARPHRLRPADRTAGSPD